MHFTENQWYGYRRVDFIFQGREALLVFPNQAADGNPWAQYTEYFDAFPATALALVEKGYYLAFIKNCHRWGNEEDYQLKKAFRDYLVAEYGLSCRSTLLGMSCGGMIAIHLAARYPEMVEALYLDAPVINLLSCPFAMGIAQRDDILAQECLDALGMTISEMIGFRGNPLDEITTLVKEKIPVILVYGGNDMLVPYTENGKLLEEAYRTANLPICVWEKPECGHHPHGLQDPGPVVAQLEYWRQR